MSDTGLINGVPADVWNASKVQVLIGASTFLIILTIVTIALRFYARLSSRAPLWWDDWLALGTVPFALLNPIYDLVQIHYGFGRHQIVMVKTDLARAERFGFNLYIILLFYNIGLATFKFSFLALYIRLFSVSKSLRYRCYGLGILITMWSIACVFAIAFRCKPVEANWRINAGTCIPLKPIFLAQSIPTITFDLLILLLPVRLIWGIQMARPARIGVLVVFLLGGIVTIISIVRLCVLLPAHNDIPWDYVSIGLWSAGEPIAGLVCCCLPAYTPILRRLLQRTNVGWTTASNKNTRNKTKLGSAVSTTGFPERATRSYWVGGYRRSKNDSDTFELTEAANGNAVKDGHHKDHSYQAVENLGPHSWNREGIRVTQAFDIQTETQTPR